MIIDYLKRGIKAGAVGGGVYGLFIALVGNHLITFAETFEQGQGSEEALATILSASLSVGAGVLWGVLLGGVVFGVVYYFLEPAIPGDDDTKIYLLGAAGFVTLSGAPWLVLPPQPPGIEQALATETRLLLYGGMMIVGALVCGLAGLVYNRLREYGRAVAVGGGAASFALLAIPIFLAPANPTVGSVPEQFVRAFQWVTVFGQFTLWVVMSSGYVWVTRRADETVRVPADSSESAVDLKT